MNNPISKTNSPYLLTGDIAIDERGKVSFVNEFNFQKIIRFYVIANHKTGTVRAWHAHKYEAKYVFVVSGSLLIGAVAINNWKHPSKKLDVYRYVLSSNKPAILYIPEGYANGFMSLTADTKVIFFSTKTLEESKKDDIRFDSRYWDIWNISER